MLDNRIIEIFYTMGHEQSSDGEHGRNGITTRRLALVCGMQQLGISAGSFPNTEMLTETYLYRKNVLHSKPLP